MKHVRQAGLAMAGAGREIRGFIKIAIWAAAAACILSPSAAFAQEVRE